MIVVCGSSFASPLHIVSLHEKRAWSNKGRVREFGYLWTSTPGARGSFPLLAATAWECRVDAYRMSIRAVRYCSTTAKPQFLLLQPFTRKVLFMVVAHNKLADRRGPSAVALHV